MKIREKQKRSTRIHHVDRCSAQTGPIFLAYRAQQVIDELVNATKKEEPIYQFEAVDGVQHNIWKTSGELLIKK